MHVGMWLSEVPDPGMNPSPGWGMLRISGPLAIRAGSEGHPVLFPPFFKVPQTFVGTLL